MRCGWILCVATLGMLPVTVGCELPPISLEGKSCPCADGFRCVRGSCVPEGTELVAQGDAGGFDGGDEGVDASPEDGGTGTREAGMDAGSDGAGPDGGGTDGGETEDAGTGADAGMDAGPPTGCAAHPDAVFCEDFEGDLSAWSLDVDANGTVELVSERAHGGAQSLRVATTAPQAKAVANAWLSTPTDGELWGRAWVYVPDGVAGLIDHFYVYDGTGSGVGYYLLNWRHGIATWYGGAGVWKEGSDDSWSAGGWVCLRARIFQGEGDGRVELYVNDRIELVETGADTAFGPFEKFMLGIKDEEAETVEYFVDDILWSTSPLDCDAP